MIGAGFVGPCVLILAVGGATGALADPAQTARRISDEAIGPSAAPVVAAERAFAADALTLGIGGSFNKWAAPGAIVIGPYGVQRVPEAYPPDAPRPADEPTLSWWPNFAGISLSGDLGFTTGGVQVDGRRTGHYFTLWARQADGTWKWVYDGGSAINAAEVPGPDSAPVVLAAAIRGSVSPAEALAEVRLEEQRLAERARTDQKAAHLDVMLPSGRLYVAPLPPATGLAEITVALDSWPARFDFAPAEGGGASAAGDLVWTYGAARWARGEQTRTGYYVRLWQRQAAGWALVFAQLVPTATY